MLCSFCDFVCYVVIEDRAAAPKNGVENAPAKLAQNRILCSKLRPQKVRRKALIIDEKGPKLAQISELLISNQESPESWRSNTRLFRRRSGRPNSAH